MGMVTPILATLCIKLSSYFTVPTDMVNKGE